MSIKGRNSKANLRKMMIYNQNIDLVNNNVYTKFGLNKPVRSQDIEQKLKSDVKSRNITLFQICEKMTIYNPNIDFVNDNVYTKFGHNTAICSQDIEQKLNSDIKSRAITLLQICEK